MIYESYDVFSFSGTKFKTKGRASGGFAILVKKYFANKIELLPASSKYWVWMKINSSKGNRVIVGFIYIPPEDSFVHQNIELSLFEQINLEIDRVKLLEPLLLVGDLNS